MMLVREYESNNGSNVESKEGSMGPRITVLFAAFFLLISYPNGSHLAAGEAASKGKPILTERGYWRHYYVKGMIRVQSEALKKADPKVFPPKAMKRAEKGVKKLLTNKKIDWAKTDWRDVAVWHQQRGLDDNPNAMRILPKALPPKNWPSTDFDDGGWLRMRMYPWSYHRSPLWDDIYNEKAFLRTHFEVPDPAKVKELILSLTYRGGIRVLVNGKELKRAHLPEGDLKLDSFGTPYPEEAYRCLIDEVPDGNKGRRVMPDLRLPFDSAPSNARGKKSLEKYRSPFRMGYLSRKGWNRIRNLRDRKLTGLKIPASMLRKGGNVLAIEIHSSHYHPIIMPGMGGNRFFGANWTAHGAFENRSWAHCRLIDLKLEDPSGSVPSAMDRPEGVQVWVDDMHNRLYPQDYNQRGAPVGVARIVGGANGEYSAQIVLGTSKKLGRVKAALSNLKQDDGDGVIPATSGRAKYMIAQPLSNMGMLGSGRGYSNSMRNKTAQDAARLIGAKAPDRKRWQEMYTKNFFYDHIGRRPPREVAANTCQPIWVTLKIPEGTPAGTYKGDVTITSEGIDPLKVPLEVKVVGWRVPSPQEFQSHAIVEHTPYGAIKHYQCEPWSARHFRLIERSFKQLARMGGDLVFIPVLKRTEMGNVEDCMIKWIRKKDGKPAFDFTILDKYLDVAMKHLGKPNVVSFVVMHKAMASAPQRVTLFDEATGKTESFAVGWREAPIKRIDWWKAFASAAYEHLKAKGLGDRVYWGHGADSENDPGLIQMFSELFPKTYWTASTHSYGGGAGGGGHDPYLFRCVSEIYSKPYTAKSAMGWKQKSEQFYNTFCPRNVMTGRNPPYAFRVAPDHAIHLGFSGMGRIGFDYFDLTWNHGYHGRDFYEPGIPINMITWPGKIGTEPSARMEAMREGYQDAELRIYLERCVDRKLLPEDLAKEAHEAVFDRFRATVSRKFADSNLTENFTGWQNRSLKVYEAAAKVAAKVGLDVDKTTVTTEVPALGKRAVILKLRNWTAKPRAWKAKSSADWLVLKTATGEVQGQSELEVSLDGSKLKAGQKLEGLVTVTDVAGGNEQAVAFNITTTEPMELLFDHPHFNVIAGKSETREFRVENRTVAEQPWKISASVPWIKIDPPEGKLAPGASLFVKLTAKPTDAGAATHETKLTFEGCGGQSKQEIASKTFVIKPTVAPEKLPLGRKIKIEQSKKFLSKHHVQMHGEVLGRWVTSKRYATGRSKKKASGKPHKPSPLMGRSWGGGQRSVIPLIGRNKFERGFWVFPHHETTFKLEGTDVHAFSAYVGIPLDAIKKTIRKHHRRVVFEVYVDGKPHFQTKLVTVKDGPQLVVVSGLEGAKEMKLVSRLDSNGDSNSFLAVWADAQFYQKEKKVADAKKEDTSEETK